MASDSLSVTVCVCVCVKPLDVPAQVRHLDVPPEHECTCEIHRMPGVRGHQLVLLTKRITKHLIQSKHTNAHFKLSCILVNNVTKQEKIFILNIHFKYMNL